MSLRLVRTTSEYPEQIKDTQRPFRLWLSAARCYIPHRFYATEQRALDCALLWVKNESKIGQTVEVLDVRYGRWLATYSRRVNHIDFQERRKEPRNEQTT
jgi:hypothetical protein